MAADTAEKRRAAQNISCPWRGPSYPTGGSAGQRAAGLFLYSGIGGGSPPVGGDATPVNGVVVFLTTGNM